MRRVNLPLRLLDGVEGFSGVEHLRAAAAGRCELHAIGFRMVAVDGAEPVAVKS